jgi:hypothetical protein
MNSKVRILGYVLVILGLTAEVVLMAKLGFRRSKVEDDLRKAVAESDKATESFNKARMEFNESRQRLTSEKLGWGFEWTIPPGGAAGAVQMVPGPVPGRLFVNGIGTANGLTVRDVNDGSGAKSVAPIVHVFSEANVNNQPTMIYIGEFVASIPELTPQSCVLEPTWNAWDANTWNFQGTVRLRSQIPAGPRTQVQSLIQTIVRSSEQIFQTNTRIAEQQKLNEAALAALAGRRAELLGDPNAEDNPDHPEYKVGLVKALEDVEEERNAVQVAVDELRRLINAAVEMRSQLVETLQQLATSLISADSETRITRRAE